MYVVSLMLKSYRREIWIKFFSTAKFILFFSKESKIFSVSLDLIQARLIPFYK